jgi:hypothetical protein
MVMDWKECLNKRIVKEVSKDKNLILSLKETAELKIKSANSLSREFSIVKVTVLYDSLREYLEALSIQTGYKIYNHECYTVFLKEVMKKPEEAKHFDKIRRIRNDINYYGRKLSEEESEVVIREIENLIEIVKRLIR